MCKCVEQMDGLLAEKELNTRIKVPFMISGDLSKVSADRVEIVTEKADKSVRKRPCSVYASYCPFCGEKYPE